MASTSSTLGDFRVLPPEIRFMIWKLCRPQDKYWWTTVGKPEAFEDSTWNLAILLASKAISAEVVPALYRHSVFRVLVTTPDTQEIRDDEDEPIEAHYVRKSCFSTACSSWIGDLKSIEIDIQPPELWDDIGGFCYIFQQMRSLVEGLVDMPRLPEIVVTLVEPDDLDLQDSEARSWYCLLHGFEERGPVRRKITRGSRDIITPLGTFKYAWHDCEVILSSLRMLRKVSKLTLNIDVMMRETSWMHREFKPLRRPPADAVVGNTQYLSDLDYPEPLEITVSRNETFTNCKIYHQTMDDLDRKSVMVDYRANSCSGVTATYLHMQKLSEMSRATPKLVEVDGFCSAMASGVLAGSVPRPGPVWDAVLCEKIMRTLKHGSPRGLGHVYFYTRENLYDFVNASSFKIAGKAWTLARFDLLKQLVLRIRGIPRGMILPTFEWWPRAGYGSAKWTDEPAGPPEWTIQRLHMFREVDGEVVHPSDCTSCEAPQTIWPMRLARMRNRSA